MVHAKSVIPTQRLKQWLENPVSMLEEAEFWVSAGSLKHWLWSLRYARIFEENHTYWGSRIEATELKGIFDTAKGGVRAPSAKLFEGISFMRSDKPNVVLFYVSEIGVVGAGLVVSCEFDFLNLFWPEEREKGERVEFPFRYKMRILWLHESLNTGSLRGDEALTSLLRGYGRSGLQHIADTEVINRLREVLKEYVSRPSLPSVQVLRNWLDQLDQKGLLEGLRKKALLFSVDVLSRLVAALKSGKHVILVGPPGTGKTILARTLAEMYNVPIVERTATSEWSRVDVVGGPMFIGGEVFWRSGALLEAIARCYESGEYGAILLLDEINRANLDKAFAEFFTIFGSSDPSEWRIPESLIEEMRNYLGKNKIDRWGQKLLEVYEKNGELRVPASFRVVATMNIYDRRYLFTLGYALLRRFVVIEVSNPNSDELIGILKEKCGDMDVAKLTLNLYESLRKEAKFELGVALLIDMAKVASELKRQGVNEKEALDNAASMVVIPQLEGLPPTTLENVKAVFERLGLRVSADTFDMFYSQELGELEK